MSKARLVITAVVVEGRTQSEVALAYGVSQSWVSRLVARYRVEGDAAFEPRSRRPTSSPSSVPDEVVALVIEIRQDLVQRGLDAGARTIVRALGLQHATTISVATVNRILVRQGLVSPQPKKRPKSSYVRFEAELPNECWQSDFTHYPLDDEAHTDTETITFLDDHSRLVLDMTAHLHVTGPIVLAGFRRSVKAFGIPGSTLTDNGLVYTARFAGGKGGRNGFETELRRLGVIQKNSRPNHPTTCGKVERFQQTLKKWLRQQRQPKSIAELQTLLDQFKIIYNDERGHTSLAHEATPSAAYLARPKATAGDRTSDSHSRIRRDRVDEAGKVTLRINGQLHGIGVGRHHARTHIILLVQDYEVRVVDAATGELLRELTIDPAKRYHGTGKPPGPVPKQKG